MRLWSLRSAMCVILKNEHRIVNCGQPNRTNCFSYTYFNTSNILFKILLVSAYVTIHTHASSKRKPNNYHLLMRSYKYFFSRLHFREELSIAGLLFDFVDPNCNF